MSGRTARRRAPTLVVMLTGLIRPIESRTITVEGHSLAEIRTQLDKLTPAGWELADAPVNMVKGSTLITSTGIIQRRDGVREIEGDTMAQLEAKVPDGWALLSVRS